MNCGNCGGAVIDEPLAPYGVTHAGGALLCASHTTVSADGSNVAQRTCCCEADGRPCNLPVTEGDTLCRSCRLYHVKPYGPNELVAGGSS